MASATRFPVLASVWLALYVGAVGSCTVSVIASTYMGAFAAQKEDGEVITWGHSTYGGDSSGVASNLSRGVVHIAAGAEAFAAKMMDGSVITWGNSGRGGDSSAVASFLSSGVDKVFGTRQVCKNMLIQFDERTLHPKPQTRNS